MEFGPRALGARSILADPRSPTAQRTLNLKVKFRESFRPFAPSVLRKDVGDWFDLDQDSPYMLLVADVKKDRRRELTGKELSLFGLERLNTVRSEIPRSRTLTTQRAFRPCIVRLTRATRVAKRLQPTDRMPGLVNTSFNVRGEPIVCTPKTRGDALWEPRSIRWQSATAFWIKRGKIPVPSANTRQPTNSTESSNLPVPTSLPSEE